MTKKIGNIIFKVLYTSLTIVFFLVTIGFSITKTSNLKCKKINININDSLEVNFVTATEILELLKNKNIKIINHNLNDLPIATIENIIKNIPAVKNAEVYTTIDNSLNIDIIQRKPIVRIITDNFFSFYIDNEGFIFPLSHNYTAHTLIASGAISENVYSYNTNNVFKIDSLCKIKKIQSCIPAIYKVAYKIKNDSMLRALICQIYYNTNKQLELVPIIGKFTLLIGDTTLLEEKLNKITIFYEDIYPRLDSSNNVEKVNLMFKNQIICKKNINL